MGENTDEHSDCLIFHMIKTPQFQTARVDGAIGGYTPDGINLSFYTERGAIPKSVTHAFNEDGSLGEPIGFESKDGVVRDIHACFILSQEDAIILQKQLAELLARFDD